MNGSAAMRRVTFWLCAAILIAAIGLSALILYGFAERL